MLNFSSISRSRPISTSSIQPGPHVGVAQKSDETRTITKVVPESTLRKGLAPSNGTKGLDHSLADAFSAENTSVEPQEFIELRDLRAMQWWILGGVHKGLKAAGKGLTTPAGVGTGAFAAGAGSAAIVATAPVWVGALAVTGTSCALAGLGYAGSRQVYRLAAAREEAIKELVWRDELDEQQTRAAHASREIQRRHDKVQRNQVKALQSKITQRLAALAQAKSNAQAAALTLGVALKSCLQRNVLANGKIEKLERQARELQDKLGEAKSSITSAELAYLALSKHLDNTESEALHTKAALDEQLTQNEILRVTAARDAIDSRRQLTLLQAKCEELESCLEDERTAFAEQREADSEVTAALRDEFEAKLAKLHEAHGGLELEREALDKQSSSLRRERAVQSIQVAQKAAELNAREAALTERDEHLSALERTIESKLQSADAILQRARKKAEEADLRLNEAKAESSAIHEKALHDANTLRQLGQSELAQKREECDAILEDAFAEALALSDSGRAYAASLAAELRKVQLA